MPLGYSWYQWEDKARSLRMLVRRLETQNSILVGRDVFHYLKAEGKDAPTAWSGDKDDVYFNSSRLPTADIREDIMYVTGVNNHEVAHLLYSPTIQDMRDLWPTSAGKNVMVDRFMAEEPYRAVWNILEDQRIEMLMVKRFSNMRPYLMAMFTRLILMENRQHIDTAYVLGRGRRYLPVRVRRMLKRRFKTPAIIPDVRRIIDEYIRLNTFKPDGLYRTHELVDELLQLLKDNNVLPEGAPQHDGCKQAEIMQYRKEQAAYRRRWDDNHQDATHADEVTADEMDELIQAINEQIEEESDGIDSDTDSQEGHQGSDPDYDGGPESKGAENGSQGGGQGTGEDAEDGGDGGADGNGQGGGAGKGGSAHQVLTTDDIADELGKAIGAVMAAHNIGEELRQMEQFIRMSHDLDAPRVRDDKPLEEELRGIARLAANAMRIRESEVDPYWDTYRSHGKLNVQRLIRNPDDRDHAFDVWQDGGLAGVDQEWVVLVDTSGSMSSHMDTLSKAVWTMKRGADLVEAKMTVLAYGSHEQHQVAYDPASRASLAVRPVLPELGGTEPISALIEAYRVLSHSQRKVKGLFIMTDGDWSFTQSGIPNLETNERVIQSLNNMGVITHLAHLRSYSGDHIDAHKCMTAAAFQKVDELPQIIKDLMTGRMQRVDRQHQ